MGAVSVTAAQRAARGGGDGEVGKRRGRDFERRRGACCGRGAASAQRRDGAEGAGATAAEALIAAALAIGDDIGHACCCLATQQRGTAFFRDCLTSWLC